MSLGLVRRQEVATDRRVKGAIITPQGKAMTDLVDDAREKIAREIFSDWEPREIEDLVRLVRKFVNAFERDPDEE